jgi:hypothetical protein
MASDTKRVQNVRKSKERARGKKRKNALKNHGSTKSQKELFKIVA